MQLTVRRVPKGWEHPVDKYGQYKTLIDSSYERELDSYNERKVRWNEGLMEEMQPFLFPQEKKWKAIPVQYRNYSFEEMWGAPPVREVFRPDWFKEICTYYQLYGKNVPFSEPFEKAEYLAQWIKVIIKKGGLFYSDIIPPHLLNKKDNQVILLELIKTCGDSVWYKDPLILN